MLTVWVIDPDRGRRGHLRATSATAVLRDADVGTYSVTVPAGPAVAQIGEGWRLLLQDGDQTVLSGPVEKIAPNLKEEEVTLTGVSDLVHLADRLTFPDPSQAAEAQGAGYWVRSGPAARVIDELVLRNVGSGALASRIVPGFALAVAQGGNLGATVSANLRFKIVLEEARALARLGGVTFDAVQEGSLIVMRFRVPADRSRSVRFTGRSGGIEDGAYSLAAPTATAVLVAGQGVGAARTIIERSRPSSWGRRIEVFKDQRDTDDAAELEQSATEQLDDGAAGATATVTVTESPGRRFGTDFALGDTVSVEFGAATVAEPVRAVELAWDGYGRTAKLTLGDHDQADDQTPAWVKKIRRLDARVRGMEVQ